jgi:ribonuclease-3
MVFKKIYNLYFSPHALFVKEVSKVLGYIPNNLSYYLLAFKHKSYSKQNNERLEFLGDSILDAVVSEYLYKNYKAGNEGDLSKLRSKIVSRTSLNEIGNKINILSFLKHKILQIEQAEYNLAGNTLEALIGAVYLDLGYKGAAKFLKKKILKPYVNWETLNEEIVDYKSLLQNYAQKENLALEYITINEKNHHDLAKFEIDVKLGDTIVGKGFGKNKKIAQQEAAQNALESLKNHKML